MKTQRNPTRLFRRFTAPACFLMLLNVAPAQVAPMPSVDAGTLAKYDKNQNGRLEAEEQAAHDADQRKAIPTEAKDEVVTLSPFEVISDTKGYFAANSVSGTRFNTKVEDLASSLTVITKEQMADFAMLDINDVFLYTASTEGTGDYTAFEIDRAGQVTDGVQTNPNGANRVRGIAPANVSMGNMETMGRVPVDPLGVDAIELSRGPNANVFGLGNPSGTLNMVPASAKLSRNQTQVTARADSYEGFRGSLDLNRVLVPNRLGVRFGAVYQRDGFVRKPAEVNTTRYNGMIKVQPYKGTTISGSFSYYKTDGARPNYVPPRDGISYWKASGEPGWDPVNQVVHVGGQTLGPFTADTSLPDYFNRTFAGNERSYFFIEPQGLTYWTTPRSVTGASPAGGGQNVRFMAPSVGAGTFQGQFTNQPLFRTAPTIRDKSVYDWSAINLAAPNQTWGRTETYAVQVDQILWNSSRQTLAAQFGFMREDSESFKRMPVGDAGLSGQFGQVFIDVNERLLDGAPNPYYRRPYIGVGQYTTRYNPSLWDTYRGQFAYKLNLTGERNALKWLGWHQLTGYQEYKYRVSRSYTFRDALVSSHPWTQPGQTGGFTATTQPGTNGPNILRGYFRYYLGDNQGGNIDYAPGRVDPGNYPYAWGGYTFTNGLVVPGSGSFRTETATLGLAATTDNTGAANNLKRILRTRGAVVQSHFLNDLIVTTVGQREDLQYIKNGSTPVRLNADNLTFDYDSIDHWAVGDYRARSGKTKTSGVVVRPFRDLPFLTRAASGGGALERGLAGLLRGLALTYNKSDSFTPEEPRQTLFQRELPNPTGESKDYGFWLNLFDGKLVLRVNRYENVSLNNRQGEASTLAQRVARLDARASDAWQLEDNATRWVTNLNPSWTPAQIRTEVARQIGLTETEQEFLRVPAPELAATQDITSKGTEIELNYNPTRFWTVAASVTETQSITTNVSPEIGEWIAQRMPVWTKVVDQERGTLWWTTAYSGSQSAASNFATFVDAPYRVIQQQEGKANPQIRRWNAKVSTSLQLAGITEQKHLKRMSVGGALRWQDKGAIGYYGKQQLPASITELDPNRPIWDKAHLYIDAFVSYRMRFWTDRIPVTWRLNVRNLQESGRLQPIGAFPDGTPSTYRIVDPRQFILQATFDL